MNRPQLKLAHREGMILLLVVAVLVLLALMGTVFILTASTDKQVSYASNDQANLNYATQGALSIVRADILNSTLGPRNAPLAIGSQTPAGVWTGSTTPARVWTGPDIGYVSNGMIASPMEDPNSSGTAPTAGTNPQIASQPWLCGAMPLEPETVYAPGATAVEFSAPTFPLTAPPTYSEEVFSGTAPANSSSTGGSSFTPRPSGNYTPVISYLTPALYDAADGQYDLGYQSEQTGAPSNSALANNGSPIFVPNASVVMPAYRYDAAAAATNPIPYSTFGTRDAMWNMLPYSSPNGTHYRFAVRIMDTSAMMNVNTGWIANATSPTQSTNNQYYAPAGAAIGGYPIFALPGTYADNSANMQAGDQTPPTRAGTYTGPGGSGTSGSYDILDWQRALNNYEAQGIPYTSNTVSGEALSLYGPGTELQWLAYGGAGGQFGLLGSNRLGSQMPNTFGATPYGTGYQDFYTTYSWSRQYASAQATNASAQATNAPASLTTGMATLYPSRVNLNAEINPSNTTQLGLITSQIGAALQTCGYAQDHSYAYAINYLDYRFIAAAPASMYGTSLNYYNGSTPVSATVTGTGAPAGEALIANALQPFINEFEVTLKSSGGTTQPTVIGYGVELYNPYSVQVDIGGWQIQFLDGTTSEGAYSIPTGTKIGAGQYLVIDNGNVPAPTGTPLTSTVAASALSPGSNMAVLEAPCPNLPSIAGITAGFGAVDAIDYQSNNTGLTGGTYYIDISRSDVNGGYEDAIGGPINVTPTTSDANVTLGAVNNASNGSGSGDVSLYNRAAGDPAAPQISTTLLQSEGYPLVNWADANCIARECSVERGNSGNTGNSGNSIDPITWQLGSGSLSNVIITDIPKDGTTSGNYTAMSNEQQLAQVYFDFPFDPRAALTSADMPTTGPVEPDVLTMLSLGSRADDPTVTPAGVAYTNLLTRTPGRINVNTAGQVPLYDAIYTAATGALGATKGATADSQLVADTIAYRDRLPASSLPVVGLSSGTLAVSTGTTLAYNTYPGYNIKSLGDLLLAWLPELETINGSAPTSFLQRDAIWADCANNFCVHSDTFAVYGLIQSLRINPNYVAADGTVNATDWYRANQMTENASGQYMLAPTPTITFNGSTVIPEFILEGQKRFVAIVDSSYSTPVGTGGTPPAPKIVAIKYLPQ